MKILHLYVLRQFVVHFLVSAAGFVVIFIVVDLSNSISAYLDRGAAAAEIASYYAWSIPYFLFLILPMAMLLGSLFCVGGLSKRNELSAMKAAGVPLFRILLPIQVFALLVSLAAWGASSDLVPRANRERALRSFAPSSPARQHRAQLVLRDQGGQVITFGEYRVDEKRGRKITIDRFAGSDLVSKLRADEAIWDKDRWRFMNGEIRRLIPAPERVVAFDTTQVETVTLVPEDFSRESRPVEQLSTEDLLGLVNRKAKNGLAASRDRVELALRVSFAFSNVIMVLFGLPLSSHTRQASRPLQVGICLLISFVFYGSLQAARAMGWNDMVDPVVAVWAPNVLFGMVGGVLLKRAHT